MQVKVINNIDSSDLEEPLPSGSAGCFYIITNIVSKDSSWLLGEIVYITYAKNGLRAYANINRGEWTQTPEYYRVKKVQVTITVEKYL